MPCVRSDDLLGLVALARHEDDVLFPRFQDSRGDRLLAIELRPAALMTLQALRDRARDLGRVFVARVVRREDDDVCGTRRLAHRAALLPVALPAGAEDDEEARVLRERAGDRDGARE